MTDMVIYVAAYLILAPVAGGILSGIERGGKSPLFQPFYDVFKLMEKEDMTTNRFQDLYISLFFLFVVAAGGLFFAGENLLLVIFTLTLSWALLVAGVYSSNSQYVKKSADMELLLMMAFEPMALLTAVGFYLYTGSFSVHEIIAFERSSFVPLIGFFLGYVYVLTMKRLTTDEGLVAELSGKTLALFEIGRWYENILLLGVVFLFFAWGAATWTVVGVCVCFGVYFLKMIAGRAFAEAKWQFAFGSSWAAAALLGSVNVAALCVPGILETIFFHIG